MPKSFLPTNAVFPTLPHILICFALIGCAPRKPIVSTAPSFHLQSVSGSSLLLSPNIPTQQSLDTSVSFALAANTEAPTASNACSTTNGMFRVERDPTNQNLRVVLPPPNRWLFGSTNSSSADENNIIDSLYSFLAATDQSDRSGCFADKNISAHDYILQNIPTRPSDSLFNAYGYRIERSGVNLKPDLRLKIERAYFTSTEKSVQRLSRRQHRPLRRHHKPRRLAQISAGSTDPLQPRLPIPNRPRRLPRSRNPRSQTPKALPRPLLHPPGPHRPKLHRRPHRLRRPHPPRRFRTKNAG